MMLSFLYRGHYDTPPNLSLHEIANLHAKVYALGHKYDLPTLSGWALHQFQQLAKDTATENLQACFAAAVVIYGETYESERDMRDFLVELALKHVDVIKIDDPPGSSVLHVCPQFAADLFKEQASSARWRCDDCAMSWTLHGERRYTAESSCCPVCHSPFIRYGSDGDRLFRCRLSNLPGP